MRNIILTTLLILSLFSCGTSRPTVDNSIKALDVLIDKEKIGTTPINYILEPRQKYKITFEGSYLYLRKKFEIKEKKRTPVVFKIVDNRPVYTNLVTGQTIPITE